LYKTQQHVNVQYWVLLALDNTKTGNAEKCHWQN